MSKKTHTNPLSRQEVEKLRKNPYIASVTAKQETQIKIAKALGVHLRDLADNSWLEEFEQQHPDANEQATRGLAVIKYLEGMGFTVSGSVLKWHYEEQLDESGNKV